METQKRLFEKCKNQQCKIVISREKNSIPQLYGRGSGLKKIPIPNSTGGVVD